MCKKNGIVVCVMALLISLAAAPVYADGHKSMCRCEGMMKMDLDRMLMYKFGLIMMHEKELNITDQQMEAIKDLMIKTKKDLIAREAQIDTVAVDVKAALWKDKIKLDEINLLLDRKYEAKKEKAKMLVASYAALKDLLSKEQIDKMKYLMKEHCEEHCEAREEEHEEEHEEVRGEGREMEMKGERS